MSHETETQEPSGSLDALAVRQICYVLDCIRNVIESNCVVLREAAPNSLPAVHAILHLGNANDEIGRAKELLEDVE